MLCFISLRAELCNLHMSDHIYIYLKLRSVWIFLIKLRLSLQRKENKKLKEWKRKKEKEREGKLSVFPYLQREAESMCVLTDIFVKTDSHYLHVALSDVKHGEPCYMKSNQSAFLYRQCYLSSLDICGVLNENNVADVFYLI